MTFYAKFVADAERCPPVGSFAEINSLLTQDIHRQHVWKDRMDRSVLVPEMGPYISRLSREQGVRSFLADARFRDRNGIYVHVEESALWLSLVNSSCHEQGPLAGRVQLPNLSLLGQGPLHIYFTGPADQNVLRTMSVYADSLRASGLTADAARRYERTESLRLQLLPGPFMSVWMVALKTWFPQEAVRFYVVNEVAEVCYGLHKEPGEFFYDRFLMRLVKASGYRELPLDQGRTVQDVEDEVHHTTPMSVIEKMALSITRDMRPHFTVTVRPVRKDAFRTLLH